LVGAWHDRFCDGNQLVLLAEDPQPRRAGFAAIELRGGAGRRLDAAGLDRAVIGLGDADLYRQLLTEFGIEGEARDSIIARLATHDMVGLEAELSELEPEEAAEELARRLAEYRRAKEAAHWLRGRLDSSRCAPGRPRPMYRRRGGRARS